MESHPQLRACAVHCVHCGIRFLTHPRNAGRVNLRCPFGCRAHHRRQRSNQRSAAYHRSPDGKKARFRRAGRSSTTSRSDAELRPDPSTSSPVDSVSAGETPPKSELRLEGIVLDESSVVKSPVLPHVRMVVNLIEGIHLSLKQLRDWLCQALRQHSIARRRRPDYVLAFLHQHPP